MEYDTTFDRIMANPERKKIFDEGYRDFLLSELHIALEQEDDISVSELLTFLAEETGVPSAVMQDKRNITLKNFCHIMNLMGYKITIKNI